MLGSLVLGLLAGFAAPHVEPRLNDLLEGTFAADPPLGATERAVLSFAICLLGAALLASILGEASAVVLALGAVGGGLAPRIQRMVRKRREPDYGDDI